MTFDDGYESVYRHAYPELRQRGWGCAIFIVADYAGDWNRWEFNVGGQRFKHLSWAQLREMEGIEVGSHTLTHRCLTALPDDELQRELRISKEIIEDKLGSPVRYLSLPFGRYDDRILDSAREAGYSAVCTMNPCGNENGFIIGRRAVYLLDTETAMRRKIANGNLNNFEMWKLRIFNRLSNGTILARKLAGRG